MVLFIRDTGTVVGCRWSQLKRPVNCFRDKAHRKRDRSHAYVAYIFHALNDVSMIEACLFVHLTSSNRMCMYLSLDVLVVIEGVTGVGWWQRGGVTDLSRGC